MPTKQLTVRELIVLLQNLTEEQLDYPVEAASECCASPACVVEVVEKSARGHFVSIGE